ncbi:hypothetical protein ARMSODRAFT_1023775 [Armillaria solidipes]|uniref:CxC2-like cysteine cluster KDZ transposase-associated domain-containing protein n=1 Tax=Armillaria solidipes TaxID=1076256 RepID=A0A2H3B978_9AGAR|nr:hypothetical protein ARMSODRAFT_1023775 [Armillaria solidipes]
MLKRAGRGHVDDGVAMMKAHDLAVLCPSCPWPGINLPDGWENAPLELRFLYILIVCMDANFCLKNQMVSSYSRDPGLGIGWGYFVPWESFDKYVLNHTLDDDISTCVGFAALAKADTKFSKGMRYTGVGAVSCVRGEFLMRLVNLHKGERYAPMDYVFGSALNDYAGLMYAIISYDIACQWFVNLGKCMTDWPAEISSTAESIVLTPATPKFHEPAHKQQNHQEFSCNYIKGMGRSDCEVPERLWGPHNQLGNSTKTMGPGSRHDVLDDNFGFWNWQKYVGMGSTLSRKYMAAIKEQNVQVEGHRGFSAGLPEDLVSQWEKVCMEWEDDSFPKMVENPFAVNEDYMSEAKVEKELEAEEAEHRHVGGRVLHATSADKFIVLALALQESQRKGTAIKEQRSVLKEKLRNWLVLQSIYMPGLVQYFTEIGEPPGDNDDEDPEVVKLWLPSDLPAERQAICMEGLPAIEERLRAVQCLDALNGIRHTLRLKTRMIHFRNKNMCGQRPSTRARAVIDGVHQRALTFTTKYCVARAAKLQLLGPGEWEETLQVLENKDIWSYTDVERKKWDPDRRGNNEDDDEPVHASDEEEEEELNLEVDERDPKDGMGETRRTLSWIWRTMPVNIEDGTDQNEEILRAEWCKSRARARRSTEEVLLLQEEMCCILKFLTWKLDWWTDRQSRRDVGGDDGLGEGLAAFALEQAKLQLALKAKFKTLWKTPLQDIEPESNIENEDSDSSSDDLEDDVDKTDCT